MKKYTFYSSDKIVIIFYIALGLLTVFTMYEDVLPSKALVLYIAYIVIVLMLSIEDNFRKLSIFIQIPISMIIYSLIPAFVKLKQVGEKFIEYGGTMANPVESEGYTPVYNYSIHLNVSNINYGFLIETIIVTVALFLLHYKIIEIKKINL